MSFSFRDKPRLSERLRDQLGDDLFNELKNQFDQERKMFFDTAPNWGSVHPSGSFSSRTGFPFDDDMMPRSGRQDIRAHLDDLAQRHPEFAEQLRCPPWAGEMSGSPSHAGNWRQNRRGSNEAEPHDQARSSSSSSSVGNSETGGTSPKPEESRGRNPFPQQVEPGQDDGGSRGQRSMSAPPDGRNQQPSEPQNQPQQAPPQPQRYVSRVNITPGKPPVAPPKQQSPQQSASNVRHIPIFVEGRDEPILPKNLPSEDPPPEHVFSQRIPQQAQQTFSKPQTYTSHHQFQPQQRFYSQSQPTRTEHTRPQQNIPQSKPETPFSQQNSAQSMQQPTTQPPKEAPKQSQQPKPQQPNDPINRVQAVQRDVGNLERMVENFTGTSRKDKQYIYLDEMLTRNLLKLDDIDTEGKENVRQARKEAIRSIQKCISILESKVPTPEEQNVAAVSEEFGGIQSVESSDKTEQREANPSEIMEAEEVETEPLRLKNTGAEIETNARETVEQTEKMDVETPVPAQQSAVETNQIAQGEYQPTATVSDTNKNENKDSKAGNGDTQQSMDVVEEAEVPITSNERSEQVASGSSSENVKTADMEVEPPASVLPEQVAMDSEVLPQKDPTVKVNTEHQNAGDVNEPHLIVVGSEQPQEVKRTEVAENGDSATPELSEEREPKSAEDQTAVQVEPVPTSSEIKDPPKSEELLEATQETVKEITNSEQTSDKDPKQEVDTKKKKTNKKVKSPSKKPPKKGSSSISDTVASPEEAQKS